MQATTAIVVAAITQGFFGQYADPTPNVTNLIEAVWNTLGTLEAEDEAVVMD